MTYRADVIGCYVAWSPKIHAAHRSRFKDDQFTVCKIGSSEDIYGRIDNHNGLDSKFSRGRWAVDRDGYGHVKDWILWRLTTDLNGLDLRARESQLQSPFSRVGDWIWPRIHNEVSMRKFVPGAWELYTVKIELIPSLFPMEVSLIEALSSTTQGVAA